MASLCLLAVRLLPPTPLLSRGWPQQSHPRMAVSLPADLSGDGGCLKRTLRIALPNAQKVADGAIVAVHFKASLADGTLLRDSRSDAPLEVRVGAQPSDTVPPLALSAKIGSSLPGVSNAAHQS